MRLDARGELRQGELALGEADLASEDAPDRKGLLEPGNPQSRLVAREHLDLERLGERVAIVSLPGKPHRRDRGLGRALAVSQGQRHPAEGVQRPGRAPRGALDGPLRVATSRRRVVVDEDSGQSGQAGGDAVGRDIFETRDALFVRRARK